MQALIKPFVGDVEAPKDGDLGKVIGPVSAVSLAALFAAAILHTFLPSIILVKSERKFTNLSDNTRVSEVYRPQGSLFKLSWDIRLGA